MNIILMIVTGVSVVITFTVCYIYLLGVRRQQKIYFDLFTNNTGLIKGLMDLNSLHALEKQKLVDLQQRYNLLLISKLKLIITGNPDNYKDLLKLELGQAVHSSGVSNLINVARILTKNINEEFKAILDILEEQEAIT